MRAMIRTRRLAPTTTMIEVATVTATDWSTAASSASAAASRDLAATRPGDVHASAMLMTMFAMTDTSQLPTRPNQATRS